MSVRRHHSLADFDYELPAGSIAQAPAPDRTASLLLHVDGPRLTDLRITDLPRLIAPGDLIVFNDTRVIKARLTGTRPSGGRVELLVERILAPNEAWVQLKASHPPKPGGRLLLDGGTVATVLARADRFFHLRFDIAIPLTDWLEAHGDVPLPPYIERASQKADATRYQTVYAREPGAVAAPTAGLHFDDELLAKLSAAGAATAFVTLHVGAGTFLPVTADDITPTSDAYRALLDTAFDFRGHHGDARTRRTRPRGRHDQPARARIRRQRGRTRASPARRRLRCSSRRATVFASSTVC